MTKLTPLFLLLLLSITVKGQTETYLINDYSIPFKATDIRAEDYKPRKVVTAYDLALNFSYLKHCSMSCNDECLILPVISINNKPIDEKVLKEIKISDILDYQFNSGVKTIALYGTRGQYGHLCIYLKDE
nr:hypothetical protein [uncultured Carboxylicivirga sp.]